LALLHNALERAADRSVEQLDVVSGRNRYAIAARVRLIQGLSHAPIIILVDSPVVHEFNSPLINYGPALGTSVHDGHLPVVVSNCDCAIYWVVISCDVLLGCQL
jgi:hypothetical protein